MQVMELSQIVPLLFAGEIAIILILYRFLLRDWIIDKWEEKIREDQGAWLIEVLEPVINEIEDRTHESLEAFQNSFFGSIGKMTSQAKDLDPMNHLRKAAKNNDWTALLVEYFANKSGLGGVLGQINPQTGQNQPKNEPNTSPELPKIKL